MITRRALTAPAGSTPVRRLRHTSEVTTGDDTKDLRRALEAERAARLRLEQIQAVTDAALSHLELDALLAELLVRIRGILDVDTVAILLLDEDAGELVARAAVGLEEGVEQEMRIAVGRGFAGRVAAEKAAIVLPDVDRGDVLNPLLRGKGVKTLLGVPLLAGGSAIGVLHVGSVTRRTFTDADTELLRLVAERVTIAIERARLHEEMLALDALKLSFVAVAAHELRTPASAIYGIVATLRERAEMPADLRLQFEETLWEQASRLRRLIEQLLDLSRLDAKTVKVEARPIVLRRVLAEIVADVDRAGVAEATFLDVDDDLAVVADPLAIERVVSNLLVNAHRHGKPPVRLTARQSDTHLRISVDDEGEGISEDMQERLFERFERGSHGGEGSGLGLAIAKAYARAHGGDIVYESRAGGTRFELLLPLRNPIS